MSASAELAARVAQRLPALFLQTLPQFEPLWARMIRAVATVNDSPRVVLDLASGTGEPAFGLARRFPNAEVVASDNDAGVLSIAQQHIAAEFASPPGRVTAHQVDLLSLAMSRSADIAAQSGLAADVVTCSLGLFMLPRAAHEPCLRGIHALLTPGGHLCASVWEDERVPLMELGGKCLAAALGQPKPPPLPFDPASLGGGHADAPLAAVGFHPADSSAAEHNATGELRLSLGAAGSDDAFMVGLLPYMGALSQIEGSTPDRRVFERARDAFDALVAEGEHAAVDAATGQVVLAPMRYRILSVIKPGA